MVNNIENESDLLIKAREGDKLAYGKIVKIYMRRAYFAALSFLGSSADAVDLSQEAFIKAYRSLKDFDTSKSFYTWYYTILRNLCLNFLRDKKRHAINFSEINDLLESIEDESQDTEKMIQKEETRKIVWEAIWKLSPEDREIITAKDIVNATYKEISELLQIPIGTVMSRLYNARKRLKKIIEESQ